MYIMIRISLTLLSLFIFSTLLYSQVKTNSSPQVYFVFNYNEGSPFHERTGDTVPIAEEKRIVGPRVFTLNTDSNCVTYVHNILPSFAGLKNPWDYATGYALNPCSAGGGMKPCQFLNGNGTELDTALIIENAEKAASEYTWYRLPQDVIDGKVKHLMIDYEWGVPHDSLWGWYYQTQSKFKDTTLIDYYEFSIADSVNISRKLYNDLHVLHWKYYTNKLKELLPEVNLGFYALPAMNRLGQAHRNKVRYKKPGTEMPDEVFDHIVDNWLGLNTIQTLYHHNYVNMKSGNFFDNNLDDVAKYTKANAVSNKVKFHDDPRLSHKDFTVGFWMAFFQWDVDYTAKLKTFEDALDSLSKAGINKIWLSSGSWKKDGSNTAFLDQLENAGVTIEEFWQDITDICQRTILKDGCSQHLSVENQEGKVSNEVTINVFPNPAKNSVNIDVNRANYNLRLIDLSGKILLNELDIKKIDLSEFTSGMYIMSIETDNQMFQKKLIIN